MPKRNQSISDDIERYQMGQKKKQNQNQKQNEKERKKEKVEGKTSFQSKRARAHVAPSASLL